MFSLTHQVSVPRFAFWTRLCDPSSFSATPLSSSSPLFVNFLFLFSQEMLRFPHLLTAALVVLATTTATGHPAAPRAPPTPVWGDAPDSETVPLPNSVDSLVTTWPVALRVPARFFVTCCGRPVFDVAFAVYLWGPRFLGLGEGAAPAKRCSELLPQTTERDWLATDYMQARCRYIVRARFRGIFIVAAAVTGVLTLVSVCTTAAGSCACWALQHSACCGRRLYRSVALSRPRPRPRKRPKREGHTSSDDEAPTTDDDNDDETTTPFSTTGAGGRRRRRAFVLSPETYSWLRQRLSFRSPSSPQSPDLSVQGQETPRRYVRS